MNRNDVVLGGGGERSPVVVVPTNWPASWNRFGARTKAERSGRVPGAARSLLLPGGQTAVVYHTERKEACATTHRDGGERKKIFQDPKHE